MAQRTGGSRRKTRGKLKKPVRKRGKVGIGRCLQMFAIGQMVSLVPEPAVQRAMPPRRMMGRMGRVVGKRGRCYKVMVKDGSVRKTMLVHPVHMRPRTVKEARK